MLRVAITTTVDRAKRLAETTRQQGLEPVSLPCIEVMPSPNEELSGARAQASHADWILVTSPRAIHTLWPDGGMPDVPVAAVGSSTAETVLEAGGKVVIVGDGGAEDLVATAVKGMSGKSVVFPHASGADLSRGEELEKAGAQVTALPVYETRPIPPGPDPVDVVVFGSPSAVSGWCQSRSLDGLVLAALGETTKSALTERGHQPDVVAPRPDFDLLIALVVEHLRDRSPV